MLSQSAPHAAEGETPRMTGAAMPAALPAPPPGKGKSRATSQGDIRALFDAFTESVLRLEQIVDRETESLNRREVPMPRDFNREKSLALLDLTLRLNTLRERDCLASGLDPKPVLARLRGKLEDNLASLDMHLKAVGEIAAIIAKAIVDHESDGTYSARIDASGTGR